LFWGFLFWFFLSKKKKASGGAGKIWVVFGGGWQVGKVGPGVGGKSGGDCPPQPVWANPTDQNQTTTDYVKKRRFAGQETTILLAQRNNDVKNRSGPSQGKSE